MPNKKSIDLKRVIVSEQDDHKRTKILGSKVVSKDGTVIAYDKVGKGPAIILVAGAMGSRSFAGFVQLANLLSNDFTAVNYDRRGRGDSGDNQPYSVEREVEDLAAVIDAVGGLAHVWGMSSGGALALEAASSGMNIKKLAVYEPPFMTSDSKRPPADHEAQLKAMIAEGRRDDAVKFFLKNMGMPGIAIGFMRLMPFWTRLHAAAHTLPYDAAVMGDYSLPAERMRKVKAPTLVIGGGKSDVRLRKSVQALSHALPNCQLRILDGQSHNVSMQVLALVLAQFFKA